jgi:hypothetical protein
VFLDQPVKVIHASAAAGALDTEHVELALDVTDLERWAANAGRSEGLAEKAVPSNLIQMGVSS